MNEELKVIISAEIDKLKRELKNGKKEIESFGKSGKEKFQAFNDSLQSVGDVAKASLATAGAAIAGVGAALLALDGSTKEYRQNQALLATAFETSGGSAKAAKDTYNELYRVLGDDGQTTEAAQQLAKLTTNEKNLAQYTKSLKGVYATFGASLPLEGLAEALNHTA